MKFGTPDHPKTFALIECLGISKREVVGILNIMWDWAARFVLNGGIGTHTNEHIARALDWPKEDARRLIDALVEKCWLDRIESHRLYIHDWHEHCEDSIHMKLARATQRFANGIMPKLNRFSGEDKKNIIKAYRRATKRDINTESVRTDRAHAVRTTGACRAHAVRTDSTRLDSTRPYLIKPNSPPPPPPTPSPVTDTPSETKNLADTHITTVPENPGNRKPARGTHGKLAHVGDVLGSMAAGIHTRKEVMVAELLARIDTVTHEPRWHPWWAEVAEILWRTEDGYAYLEERVRYIEDCADPVVRKAKDLGPLDNPGARLGSFITDWCRAHGVQWPQFPKLDKARDTSLRIGAAK